MLISALALAALSMVGCPDPVEHPEWVTNATELAYLCPDAGLTPCESTARDAYLDGVSDIAAARLAEYADACNTLSGPALAAELASIESAAQDMVDDAWSELLFERSLCGCPCPFPSFQSWIDDATNYPPCPGDPSPNLCSMASREDFVSDVNFVQGALWAELQHLCINGEISDPELWNELTDEATDVVSSCWDLFVYDQAGCCE